MRTEKAQKIKETLIFIIMGTAAAFNILVIMWKIQHDRITDAIFDGVILAILTWTFGGSLGGMVIATIASAIVSVYLIVNPPDALLEKLNEMEGEDE